MPSELCGPCAALKLDWCGCPCPSLQVLFYALDVGTDIFNTITFFRDCHYHIAGFSLFFIFLPNIVCGIAACLRDRTFKSFIIPCLALQPMTLIELCKKNTEGYPGVKVLEVLFESVPQFIIQMYAMFLYGFGFSARGTYHLGSNFNISKNVVDPGFKIFGVITSAFSIFHGVNSFIVNECFSSYNWRYILKSSLYTVFDITARLLFYPVAWILFPGYAILFNVVLFLLWAGLYKAFVQKSEKVEILVHSLGINVCPQIAAPFKKGNNIDPVGKMWNLAKIFSNFSFFFFALFLQVCLTIDVNNAVIDTERLKAKLPENFNTSICDEPGSYQHVTYIYADHLKIIIYIVYGCIIVSSIEIFIYYFCHDKWRVWMLGMNKRNRKNDKDKIIQLKVKS